MSRSDADAVSDALVSIGAAIVDTQPIEESRRFNRDGIVLSSAFFDRNDDGTFGVLGRWSDWVFPPGSFGATRGDLDGLEVPTMSVEGMLAMKEQYATLRNGGPLREKDVRDVAALKALIANPRPDHPQPIAGSAHVRVLDPTDSLHDLERVAERIGGDTELSVRLNALVDMREG